MGAVTALDEAARCMTDGVNRVSEGLDRVSERLRDILGVLDKMIQTASPAPSTSPAVAVPPPPTTASTSTPPLAAISAAATTSPAPTDNSQSPTGWPDICIPYATSCLDNHGSSAEGIVYGVFGFI